MNNEFLNSEQEQENNHSKKNKKIKLSDVFAYLVCLLVALGIWVYVVGLETENYEYTFENVAVQLEGVNELKNDRNLSILSGYDATINITVVGSRKDILKYTSEDIYAYINLDGVTKADRHALDIVVELPEGMRFVSSNSTKINVLIDELVSMTFGIEIVPRYILPAGYTLHDAELSVETVTVTGPKTVLEEIASARVVCDLGTVSTSVTFSSSFEFIDAEGNTVTNPYIKTDVSEVMVKIPVTMKKTVELIADFSPADMDKFNYGIKFEPETVEIVGDPQIVLAMSEIKVKLGDAAMSEGPREATINILELPENVKLFDQELETIKFTVTKTEIEPGEK